MKSETELLTAVKSGDEDAFQSVILLYEPLLKGMVSELLQDGLFTKNDAEDLHQEAVIALYQAAMMYDQTQTAVTFGLYAKICVKNRLLSVRRKRQRTEAVKVGRVPGIAGRQSEMGRRTESGFCAESDVRTERGLHAEIDERTEMGLRAEADERTEMGLRAEADERTEPSLRTETDEWVKKDGRTATGKFSGSLSDRMLKSGEKALSDFEVSVYRLYLREYTAAEIAVQLGRSRKSVENALYRIRRKFLKIAKENS